MSDGFRILERLIHLTSTRHGIITSNIANVDTPNYKARDIRFDKILDDAVLEIRTTSPQHIKSSDPEISGTLDIEPSRSWGDGNNVELDMEVAKMTENAMLFQAGIKMLATKISMFKSALRRK